MQIFIEPISIKCKAGKTHEIVIRNTGSDKITTDEIIVFIDESKANCLWDKNRLAPAEEAKCLTNVSTSAGTHVIKIILKGGYIISFGNVCS